ncbi:MAG: cytochrome c [Thermoanaerobaculia bacterium]|nr:cytochrome c [Thermoanaerobaculia bacterium]
MASLPSICRRHALTALGLALAALVAAACGGGRPGPADPAVQRGRAVFDRVCATCHGRDARGLPRLGKSLLGNQFTKSLSDDELVQFLKTGRPAFHELNETGVDMPPKGGDPSIPDDDLRAVVAFLRTL